MPKFECPTCGTNVTVERLDEVPFRPFCCQRCKLIDLGRWLDGTHTISEPLMPGELKTDESSQT